MIIKLSALSLFVIFLRLSPFASRIRNGTPVWVRYCQPYTHDEYTLEFYIRAKKWRFLMPCSVFLVYPSPPFQHTQRQEEEYELVVGRYTYRKCILERMETRKISSHHHISPPWATILCCISCELRSTAFAAASVRINIFLFFKMPNKNCRHTLAIFLLDPL